MNNASNMLPVPTDKTRLSVTILRTGGEDPINREETKRAYSHSGKYEVDLKVLKL